MKIEAADGVALIVTLMAMLLLSAIGGALILNTSSDTLISGNVRLESEGLYAADAVAERALGELLSVPDWTPLLDGTTRSAFVDGQPTGSRVLADGSRIDLSTIVNVANCFKPTACTGREMDTYTQDRPWGSNNPRWQLYAYGPLEALLPIARIRSPFYVVLMVADDPSETDQDPLRDGGGAGNPGRGVLSVRAEAFGPRGAHKVIEATVARVQGAVGERGYTGQRGEDAANSYGREAAVRSNGLSLSTQTFTIDGP